MRRWSVTLVLGLALAAGPAAASRSLSASGASLMLKSPDGKGRLLAIDSAGYTDFIVEVDMDAGGGTAAIRAGVLFAEL